MIVFLKIKKLLNDGFKFKSVLHLLYFLEYFVFFKLLTDRCLNVVLRNSKKP